MAPLDLPLGTCCIEAGRGRGGGLGEGGDVQSGVLRRLIWLQWWQRADGLERQRPIRGDCRGPGRRPESRLGSSDMPAAGKVPEGGQAR